MMMKEKKNRERERERERERMREKESERKGRMNFECYFFFLVFGKDESNSSQIN